MKGRLITLEEFERMLAKVEAGLMAEAATRPPRDPAKPNRLSEAARRRLKEKHAASAIAAAPSWKQYLRGLWLSGLRLSESLELCWDRQDRLCVDMQPGERPMLRIPAELEKGHKDRLLPMAPEFAEFLEKTPEDQRTGYVFQPMPRRPWMSERIGAGQAARTISEIGKLAGVKVKTDADGTVKFASAHDLRRSFGERWASRVMPQVLMVLMRHESIETTMRFYVGRNAQATADVLWTAHKKAAAGNTSGNSEPIGVGVSADDASVSHTA